MTQASPLNGLIPDSTRKDSPSSIATVGFGLAAHTVGVRRGYMTREAGVASTLKVLRFFQDSEQSEAPDATGHKGFYYHFLDMQSGRRVAPCELSLIDSGLLIAGMLTAATFFDARATAPDIPGLAEAGYLTNETVFNLTKRPSRLLVIGGGPLGCELAQAFCRLGSEVSIVQHEPQFLPQEERDASQLLAMAFGRDDVQVHLNSEIKRVEETEQGKSVHIVSDEKHSTIVADEILAGAGRAPNVQGLNLETAGSA